MARAGRLKTWGLLATGLAIGLSIGGALAVGIWAGGRSPTADRAMAGLGLGELKLRAMASHGAETFAIATGPIDEGVEGLFTLDFLTGDLQCYIINPRTGGLGGWFKTNIAKDLEVEKGKKPSYLIATGEFVVAGGQAGNIRPAGCICYVVDANTGQVAAYTFPWARGSVANNVPQASDMKLIYKWKARDISLRE